MTEKISRAKQIFQELVSDNEARYLGDYTPIIDSFGEVVVRYDDDDYQGDSYVLYHEKDKFGILIFGWGSCSGCDALQACGNIKEVDDLIDNMENSIKWFSSAKETYNYLHDEEYQKTQWVYHTGGFSKFCDEVGRFLAKFIVEETLIDGEKQ